jgi:hypothetical protein
MHWKGGVWAKILASYERIGLNHLTKNLPIGSIFV